MNNFQQHGNDYFTYLRLLYPWLTNSFLSKILNNPNSFLMEQNSIQLNSFPFMNQLLFCAQFVSHVPGQLRCCSLQDEEVENLDIKGILCNCGSYRCSLRSRVTPGTRISISAGAASGRNYSFNHIVKCFITYPFHYFIQFRNSFHFLVSFPLLD